MRLFVTALLFVFAAGCALRPRYRDLVKPDATEAHFVLRDTDTGAPLAGVKYEMSEWRNAVRGTTGPDGTFTLPVDKKYADENPVFAVLLPAGVKHYRVEPVARQAPAVAPPPVAEPGPTAPPPSAEAQQPSVPPGPAPLPAAPAPGKPPTESPAGGPR